MSFFEKKKIGKSWGEFVNGLKDRDFSRYKEKNDYGATALKMAQIAIDKTKKVAPAMAIAVATTTVAKNVSGAGVQKQFDAAKERLNVVEKQK